MILSLVSKSDTWSIFFSTRCRTSDKNKIDQVSDLAVFFDQRSYSTSCHVRRKGFRREVVHRILTPSLIIYDERISKKEVC